MRNYCVERRCASCPIAQSCFDEHHIGEPIPRRVDVARARLSCRKPRNCIWVCDGNMRLEEKKVKTMRSHFVVSLLGSTRLVFISTSSIYADGVAVDTNGRRQTWPAGASKSTTWETGIWKMVPPEYPYEARLRRQGTAKVSYFSEASLQKVVDE